jgi:hypothetical protein
MTTNNKQLNFIIHGAFMPVSSHQAHLVTVSHVIIRNVWEPRGGNIIYVELKVGSDDSHDCQRMSQFVGIVAFGFQPLAPRIPSPTAALASASDDGCRAAFKRLFAAACTHIVSASKHMSAQGHLLLFASLAVCLTGCRQVAHAALSGHAAIC